MNTPDKKIIFIAFAIFFAGFVFSQTKPDALKMYQTGQYKSAIEVCLNEIKVNANNLDSYVVLTWALLADKQYDETLLWCERSKTISQYDPRILETEGEAYFYLGKNAEAIKSFETYVVYAPMGNKLAVVYNFLGEIYVRLKKFAHADIAFSTAVRFSPNNALWWTRLGYAREQLNETTYALQAYEQALELDKNLVDAQNGRKRVLSRM